MKHLACIAALSFAAAMAAWAGEPVSLEARLASGGRVEVKPGTVITASVVVTNRSAREQTFSEDVELPAGWIKVAPSDDGPLLAPGETAIRLLAIAVPAGSPAGDNQLSYRLRGSDPDGRGGSVVLAARVAEVRKISLSFDEKPNMVIAGQPFEIRGTLTNLGNSRASIDLGCSGSADFAVHGSPSRVELNPGERMPLRLRVSTPALTAQRRHVVTLTADPGDASATARASCAVNMVPLVAQERDPIFRLPMQMRTVVGQESGQRAFAQVELAGEGDLDERGKRHVDFLFRGPDHAAQTAFAERDEYRFHYQDEQWDLRLGDGNFSISPLLDRNAIGRGMGAQFHDGPWTVGGFAMESRWRSPAIREAGVFAEYQVAHGLTLRGNFLQRESDSHEGSRSLGSVAAAWSPGKYLELQTEYGLGDQGTGYRVATHGTIGKATYAIERNQADRSFRGPDVHANSTTASLLLPITQKLYGTFSYLDFTDQREYDLGLSSVATKERALRLELRYQATPTTELLLGGQDLHREDVILPAAFDFSERSLRVGVQQELGPFRLRSTVDVGTIDNVLRPEENGSFLRSENRLTWRPSSRHEYSVYAAYGPNAFTGERLNELSFGAHASWRVRDSFIIDLDYARNAYDARDGGLQDQVHAQMSYTFANRNVLSLLGRWARGSGGGQRNSETAFVASYTVPFELPLGGRRDLAEIAGRVWLAERTGGRPLRGVIVQADEATAVTDKDGRFIFRAIEPGKYRLQIDQASLGAARVTAAAFPQSISVRGGEKRSLTVTALPAGTAIVNVSLPGAPPAAASNIPVELRCGAEVLHEETDHSGAARFGELRPGKWQVRVAREAIPGTHRLERSDALLNVNVGETAEVTFAAVARRRVLQMIDSGELN